MQHTTSLFFLSHHFWRDCFSITKCNLSRLSGLSFNDFNDLTIYQSMTSVFLQYIRRKTYHPLIYLSKIKRDILLLIIKSLKSVTRSFNDLNDLTIYYSALSTFLLICLKKIYYQNNAHILNLIIKSLESLRPDSSLFLHTDVPTLKSRLSNSMRKVLAVLVNVFFELLVEWIPVLFALLFRFSTVTSFSHYFSFRRTVEKS